MESNSQLFIYSVLGKIKVPSQILNLVNDILLFTGDFKIVQFNYCKRDVNRMIDKIAMKLIVLFVSLLQSIIFPCFFKKISHQDHIKYNLHISYFIIFQKKISKYIIFMLQDCINNDNGYQIHNRDNNFIIS